MAMWRKIALTSCVGLSLVLAGCGGGSETSSSGGTAAAVPSEPITIEYWHVNSQDFGGEGVKELVKRFNELHTDIQVLEKYQPGNYAGLLQKAQAAISGNHPPDVAQVGYNFISYVTENVPYTPVEEVAKQDAKEPNFIQDNFLPNILELGQTKDGKVVGLPYSVSNPVMYYNADLLKQVGWDADQPPKTWEEVQKLSELVRDKTGNYGLYIQEPPDNWAQYALAKSNGGEWLTSENGTPKAAFDSPETVETFQMIGDMVKDKRALHAKWEEGLQAFSSGKVAMVITTIAKRESLQQQSKFDLRTALFPTFGEKKRSVPAGGNALFIFSKDPKKQAAAWEFIKFMESPESLAVWTKATGYLPPRKGVAEDPNGLKPFLETNPLMKPALEQMADVIPWVNFPGPSGLQAEQALIDARDEILSGTSDAQAAIKKAVDKVNKLIQ
ncbi:ABC transporter substrate-binding protein [Brevibacillus massiliensis]|uniref:ABC transporter substrate-binding protein n=1 Tax=Brevibacillus massiliensis TaxID=1118054 RepID=UPI0003812B7D|nr:ABC transporter substrate-binding protein [Brevibacillus massiliensis]